MTFGGPHAAREAAAAAEHAMRLRMGMHAESLCAKAAFKARMDSWDQFSGACFSNMAACSSCGIVSLGGPATGWTVELDGDPLLSEASLANPFLNMFCGAELGTHLCSKCSKPNGHRTAIKQHLVYMSPSYQRMLLNCHPLKLQMLSLLDARLNLIRHWQGFSLGSMSGRSLLVSPIINWDAVDLTNVQYDRTNDGGIGEILAINLRSNPIMKNFRWCTKCG